MDAIKKRCLACGWPANNGDGYSCKCGGNSFDRDDDYIPSYSLFGFPPCECLSNGRTIKYKPSYSDASEITLKIKNVCQVFDSYIIYAAEKMSVNRESGMNETFNRYICPIRQNDVLLQKNHHPWTTTPIKRNRY